MSRFSSLTKVNPSPILKPVFMPVLMALVIVVSVSACSEQTDDKRSPKPTFLFLDGRSVTLDTFQSKWVLVNFWSVSCPPCYEEMPDLVKLDNEPGLDVIGVSMSYDRPDLIVETQKKMNLSYPLSLDLKGQVNQAFGSIDVIPTSFLIDPQGKIEKKYLGTVSYEQLMTDLKKIKQKINGSD